MQLDPSNYSEIVWSPNSGPQTVFLSCTSREVFYGGSAGGGKTDALIALLLRWAHHPLHRAILLRRTRPQLQEVIDRCKVLFPQIVPGTTWHEGEKRFRLPAGGFIRMGHAEHERDIYQFKTDEYNLICFDELTSFTEKQYLFMFSRNRSKSDSLPSLVRAASNPGDIGHAWVAQRFITGIEPFSERIVADEDGDSITTTFIPATVMDNPMLPNRADYIAGLKAMGPEMASAYLYGKWEVFEGAMFTKHPREVAHGFKHHSYYIVRCMDYGWADHTCIYWLAVYPNGVAEIINELYINETTVDGIAALVKNYESRVHLKNPRFSVGGKDMFNTQGTSAQSIATMLQQRSVWFEMANTDRVAGWAMMLRMLHSDKLRVWVGKAPNLMRTLTTLQRDENKVEDIKAKGQEDHPADSLRYGLMAIFTNYTPVKKKVDTIPEGPKDMLLEKIQEDLRNEGQSVIFEGLGAGW